MKIVLAALNAKYIHSNLAVYDLEAYAKTKWNREIDAAKEAGTEQENGILEILVREYTINHNLDLILQSLYQEKAAVVAFSCYIWNIHEILTIARELKKVAPQTHIWLGGPEVSYESAGVLQNNPFIEGIMQGEGEETFYELTKCWWKNSTEGTGAERGQIENGQMEEGYKESLSGILGIVYRNAEGEICENGRRPLISLDEVPFIYNDLSRFENKILYYETSRGCPFSCSYCLSSIDKHVRFRSIRLVKEELQFFLGHNVPQVKFIDRTFNCKKAHALAVWQYITEHDNGITNFHFEVAADLIGEEELALFRTMRPGLIQLEIGLQSTNPATIKEIRRVMDVDRLKRNVLAIGEFRNIHQHLDLIAGLPYEDFVTFQKSFNDAYGMRPNQLQLGFLKVLKGSYMGEQINAYGLQYQDGQPYEVLSTKWISFDELHELKQLEEMVEVYYNSGQFSHVLNYLVPFFESPYMFYEALGAYYADRQFYGNGMKREARYMVLRQFCIERFENSDENSDGNSGIAKNKMRFSRKILDSLLTYDYYLRENAKSRPVWSPAEPVEKQMYHAFFKRGGTEEISLQRNGYDSKAAARVMHIEPLAKEALIWIAGEGQVGTQNSGKHCQYMAGGGGKEKLLYCLFDYEKRNPLSKDAGVSILTHL